MRFPLGFSVTGVIPSREQPSSPDEVLDRVRSWLVDDGAVVTHADGSSLEFTVPWGLFLTGSHLLAVNRGRVALAEDAGRLRVHADFRTARVLQIPSLAWILGLGGAVRGGMLHHISAILVMLLVATLSGIWRGYSQARTYVTSQLRELLPLHPEFRLGPPVVD